MDKEHDVYEQIEEIVFITQEYKMKYAESALHNNKPATLL